MRAYPNTSEVSLNPLTVGFPMQTSEVLGLGLSYFLSSIGFQRFAAGPL